MFERINLYINKKFSLTEIQEKLLKGSFWMFIGVAITKFFDLISIFIIARILSPEEFGRLSIIKSTTFTFVLFSVGSLGLTATKYIAKFIDDDKVRCQNIISYLRLLVPILSFLLSFFTYFFSSLISDKILNDIDLTLAVKLTAITIFFSSLNAFQKGILAGLEKFKIISVISVTSGITTSLILVLVAYFYGLKGVFIVLPINAAILWVFSIYHTNKSLKLEGILFRLGNYKYFKKILVKFTLPSFLSGLLITPTTFYCNVLLVNSFEGYLNLAIYIAAFNLSIITLTINGVLGRVFYPIIMKNFNNKINVVEKTNIILPFFIGVILNTPLIIFPDVMKFAYGNEYNSIEVFNTLVLIANFTIIISFKEGISRNFAAANLMWISLLSNITWAFLSIISMKFLVDSGASGRASAFLYSYLLTNLIFLPVYISKKLLNKQIFSKYFFLIISSILISNAIYYFMLESFTFRIITFIFVITLQVLTFKLWIRKKNTLK